MVSQVRDSRRVGAEIIFAGRDYRCGSGRNGSPTTLHCQSVDWLCASSRPVPDCSPVAVERDAFELSARPNGGRSGALRRGAYAVTA